MADNRCCKNCGWCQDPTEIFIECNLFEEERNDFYVCPSWEPRDEYQRTEDALIEGFSVGTAEECCNTCGFSMPDGVAAITCLDKGERRSKRSVCLDWRPKENNNVQQTAKSD